MYVSIRISYFLEGLIFKDHAKLTLFNCLIIPLLDYGDKAWGDKNNDTLMGQPQVIQNKAAKVLHNLPPTKELDRLDPLAETTLWRHTLSHMTILLCASCVEINMELLFS